MSKGDLIALRRDLEEQVELVSRRYGGFAHSVQDLSERLNKIDKELERLRMSVTALSNLVKGNVR